MSTHFYDSASPENVPSGVYAAVYVNGFTWSRQQVDRMAKVFRVSVRGEADWAHSARCIDVENGAATPADAVEFVKERRRLGYDDATVYVNRSNHQATADLIEKAGLEPPFWWVATLDGTQDVAGAWAVQYQGGTHAAYDLSILHGVNNFHAP